jgi:hypothetical protein
MQRVALANARHSKILNSRDFHIRCAAGLHHRKRRASSFLGKNSEITPLNRSHPHVLGAQCFIAVQQIRFFVEFRGIGRWH